MTEKIKKICFLLPPTYFLFSKKPGLIGGAEINFYYLAKEFAQKEGYIVDFFVGDFGQSSPEYYDKLKLIKIKHFNYGQEHRFYYPLSWRFYLIKTILNNPSDVFIISTMSVVSVYLTFLVQIVKKKKVIYRVASDLDVNGIFTRKNTLNAYFYRKMLKRADVIVCQNSKQADILYNTHQLKAVVIQNGFPIKLPQIHHISREKILWIGKADENKNPLLFLSLAELLPNENFVMILTGDNKTKRDIINNYQDKNNIQIIDFVSFFEIDNYFKNAKCFVNTSKFEGSPNTFIQAGLNLCPILSFNVNPDDMITKYSLGCYCDGSLERAVNFIKTLDSDKISQYGKNALNYVSTNHNLNDTVKKYQELIEKFDQ
ncbi:MAG: glycosyltransferase [Bacteroidales bacterium]|nr:glycosyltransferase [Bacteroidales bacterium]